TRPGGLRPRGPPTPSLAGPHDPRSAPAGAPVARLARYAARLQRVQNSRCEPHNGLIGAPADGRIDARRPQRRECGDGHHHGTGADGTTISVPASTGLTSNKRARMNRPRARTAARPASDPGTATPRP